MSHRQIKVNKEKIGRDKLDELLEYFRAYRSRGEREPALIFRGRNEIREFLRSNLRRIRAVDSNAGFLQVIQGAPGVGKTSLLHQLEKDLTSEDLTCVHVQSDQLNSPRDLLSEFIRGIGVSTSWLYESAHVKTGGRLGLSDTGITQDKTTTQFSALEVASAYDSIWGVMQQIQAIPQKHVFLLLVDETQQQKEILTESFKLIARQLLAGDTKGIKVYPIFAGLSDTVKTLTLCGLSRLPEPIQLGSLALKEAEEVVLATLNTQQTGIDSLVAEEDALIVAHSLALASEGWPRHLHAYLTSFADELANGLATPAAHFYLDLDKVLDRGHVNRFLYYERRLEHSNISVVVTQSMMSCLSQNPGAESLTARDLLDYVPSRVSGPSIETIESEIERAEHAGLLQYAGRNSGERSYEFPISSMRTFFQCKGSQNETLKHLQQIHRKQMRSV